MDVDGDGELNENEFLEVQKYHYLEFMSDSKFINNQSMCASGMSKGFRADGEARGDSQPMYDKHRNLIYTLPI